jgi:NitT/TauT family transport system substrate-binding protein
MKALKWKNFLLWLFVIFLAVAAGIDSASSQNLKEQGLRILAPKSTSSIPLLLLAEEDPFPEMDIRTDIFINHPQALALLLRGEADLLFTGTSQGWENYLSGGPLVMINTGTWAVSYIIGRDPTIRSFSDLSGKRIALPFPGAPLDFQTRCILKRKGIDPERDLSISYSPPSQAMARLIGGQLDAAPLPEPLASYLVMQRGFYRLIDYKEAWAELSGGDPKSPQVSLFATRSFSREKKEIINRLIGYWREAVLRVTDNPQEMAQKFSEVLGFPVDVLSEAIRNTLYYLPLPSENTRRVQAYYNQVKDFLPGERGRLDQDFFFAP